MGRKVVGWVLTYGYEVILELGHVKPNLVLSNKQANGGDK